jgi:aspartyl-tRNA(Asn)/glutamyl-tRNA(Gln) amidotransferase subunit B
VDLNRAGTPLVEIVTEPDLGSPADVRAFLTGLKRILEYAAVSDCNMEEGSLRADANVSVRRRGRKRLGTKTEIKNVNSFSGIERAVDIEVARQRRLLESGGQVRPETLLWDDHRGRLRPMRSKEESHDYRYFPDPDLPPLVISSAEVERARSELPELPADRLARLVAAHGLTRYDAEVLTRSAATADYFERAAGAEADAKAVANWVMGPVQALMNERGEDAASFPVRPETLATLVRMVDDGVVSDGAARTVLASLAREGGDPERLVDEMGLRQVREKGRLDEWIATVLDENAEVADRYRAGEEKLLGFLVGRVMRRSEGRADPRRVGEILRERLGHK